MSKSDKRVSFCLNSIRKLRDELRHKNLVIKLAYTDLINEKFDCKAKIEYAISSLGAEIRRQGEKDNVLIDRINQLFIDEGEKPPFQMKQAQ